MEAIWVRGKERLLGFDETMQFNIKDDLLRVWCRLVSHPLG